MPTDPPPALAADELAAHREGAMRFCRPTLRHHCAGCGEPWPCLDALALAERETERQIAYSAALLETLLYLGTWTCANVPWHSEEVRKEIAELQDRDAATHAMLQRMAETDHEAGEWQERAENARTALAQERARREQVEAENRTLAEALDVTATWMSDAGQGTCWCRDEANGEHVERHEEACLIAQRAVGWIADPAGGDGRAEGA